MQAPLIRFITLPMGTLSPAIWNDPFQGFPGTTITVFSLDCSARARDCQDFLGSILLIKIYDFTHVVLFSKVFPHRLRNSQG